MKWATLKIGQGYQVALGKDTSLFLPNRGRGITLLEVLGSPNLQNQLLEQFRNEQGDWLDSQSVVFAAVVPHPEKVICVGLNYRDHAAEMGGAIPEDPVIFGKFSSALTGHQCPIVLPRVSSKVDYEVELVLVVGKGGRYIPLELAWEHIAGVTVGNDVSARDWQLEKVGAQWMIGKSFDTFAPVGPFLVTLDEVPRIDNLAISLKLNGQTMQQSRTNQFLFSIPRILHYVSRVVTLKPGDLIFTGTPSGVGMARNPPVWLKPGDHIEAIIEGVGTLVNPVSSE